MAPPGWAPASLELGDWKVTALSDGWLRLDGGAMWGVVPAVLWREMTPPDPDNTILMALRPFLLEGHGARVLIEPGVGDRWSAKETAIYRLDRRPALEDCLARLDLGPDDVTHVVATHCHWDHIGAAVVRTADGALAPRFPRARHVAPQVEIENARHPDRARRASYRADDVEPLLQAGVLEGVTGVTEVLPGLSLHVLGGHSDGASVVTIGGQGGTRAVFWGDVVPTGHHVQPPYIMAYDLDVARSFDVRSEWLERSAAEGWVGLFYHDADRAFGRIVRAGKRYATEDVAEVHLAGGPA